MRVTDRACAPLAGVEYRPAGAASGREWERSLVRATARYSPEVPRPMVV